MTDGLPLRILHLGKYYPPAPGGIESHVQTLARGQANLGHEVAVICVNHADKNGKDIMHARWRKTASFLHMDGKVRVERIGRFFNLSRLEICPQLIGRLRVATKKFDIVHLHTPNPLMLATWWLVGNRNVPLVVTHHSDVIKQQVLHKLVRPFEISVYRKAEKIFTTSPKYLEKSVQLISFSDKVVPLPLGIDLSPFRDPVQEIQDQSKKISQDYGAPLWLMVGRLTYYKGHHVALRALAKVEGKLVIVGNGHLESELRSEASRLGVFHRVIWLPSASSQKLTALYHAATALWFPSIAKSEGFGLVQVEAMASGCPVINTDIPGSGVSWVSLDNVSGLTVPVEDADNFAKAVKRLVNESGLRARLANGAKERAMTEFDSETMVRRSIKFYQAALA